LSIAKFTELIASVVRSKVRRRARHRQPRGHLQRLKKILREIDTTIAEHDSRVSAPNEKFHF
jgi:hypothetical protein